MFPDRVVHIIDNDKAAWKETATMLRAALGCRTECYASGAEFLAHLNSRTPGCVLLSVHMPEFDGMEVQRRINERGADLAVIILTDHANTRLAVRAMKAGAADFLEKPYLISDLLSAVGLALAPRRSGKAEAALADVARAKVNGLSPRERQVLQGLLAGHANKQMAYKLGLSIRTIEMHRAHVMEKLSTDSVSHAVQMALAAGLEPLPSHLQAIP